MKIFSTLMEIIFPTYCVSCNKDGCELCIDCLSLSPSAERESADWIFPLFDYRHPPVKKAIWLLKYKGKTRIATIFAEAMYARILEELSDRMAFENFKEPIIIPIPLSLKRIHERGFNQATLICKALIKLDKNQPTYSDRNFKLEENILIKIKNVEHQALIKDRKERLRNIIDSFKVKNEEKIKGKNVILIDDVTTTGATLNEARKVLKKSGAKKIIAFTVAH